MKSTSKISKSTAASKAVATKKAAVAKKVTAAAKAVATKKAAAVKKAVKPTKKAAVALPPAQKAAATRKANKALLAASTAGGAVIGYNSAYVVKAKPVKKVKVVKGIIKAGAPGANPPTAAELKGDFTTVAAATPPAPKTVFELLKTEANWIKHQSAQTATGASVGPLAANATKFCLSGAVARIYQDYTGRVEAMEKLNKAVRIYKLLDEKAYVDPISFNDNSSTTFTDVKRVVAFAGV